MAVSLFKKGLNRPNSLIKIKNLLNNERYNFTKKYKNDQK